MNIGSNLLYSNSVSPIENIRLFECTDERDSNNKG